MKYKLIKTYPGCGFTIGETVTTEYIYDNSTQRVFLKDFPEFWEKVVEYEVYQVQEPHINKLWKRKNNDTFGCFYEGPVFYCNGGAIRLPDMRNYIFKDKWKVYSMRNIVDGTIFTIGDIVNITGDLINREITTFVNSKDVWKVWVEYFGPVDTTKITHSKPLFTTKDGVDLYKGDTYYQIISSNFEYMKLKAYDEGNFDKSLIIFSTLEKVKEYIFHNKPCLSYSDVYDLVDFNEGSHLELDELVKSKL